MCEYVEIKPIKLILKPCNECYRDKDNCPRAKDEITDLCEGFAPKTVQCVACGADHCMNPYCTAPFSKEPCCCCSKQ